jgi:uncharacterized RDD family membrane protein YckC
MSSWDAQRWHAATGELDQLLGRDAAERAAAIEALRARDPRLADDVAQLLRDHESAQAGSFLEQGPGALLTTTESPGASGPRPPRAAPLPPDTVLGGYHVRRVLGRGGMGVVYEAEEIESGRLVALKVLEQRFGDARERERFEREGRLAASIDHEHCVFVFTAAEIGGVPAIAMELMQGTLADRLADGGPLPPAAAVDTALQLVAGLQAAADAGILHRDVKPSNCFVDADGSVKIGDFGISRSVRPNDDTAFSTRNQLAATPTYASPEQLRGAALDARADIYSLGATLYELVTGRRPLSAPDLMSLLMAVANDAPTPPDTIVPAVPRGLSRVILRCLAKRPEDRYPTYAALAAALEPYSTSSPTPATLGRRLIAGTIDHMVIGLFNVPITLSLIGPMMADGAWRLTWTHMVASVAIVILYYGGCEALWARTPGKALLGLTVTDAAGRPPRAGAALARAALYASTQLLLAIPILSVWGPSVHAMSRDIGRLNAFTSVGHLLLLLTLFSTSRRRNGYASLHDLATGTRVVERVASAAADRPAATTISAVPTGAIVDRRGAFGVLDGAIDGWPGWRRGVDERLRRPVWIRELPVGTPPVRSIRVSLARPTRLRWLAGRRTAQEAWDVYEAVAGVPIAQACRTRRSWSEVRRWIADLAHELAAQHADDQPPLDLDRVWILDSGRAKLLDDPTGNAAPGGNRLAAGLGLLIEVARLARTDATEPWPLAASGFVDRLSTAPPASLADAAKAADVLGRSRPAITRGWRGLSIATLAAFPLLGATMAGGGILIASALARNVPIDARIAAHALREVDKGGTGPRSLAPTDRDAVEAVLASRYRAILADPTIYAPERFLLLTPAHKVTADRILRRRDDAAAVTAAAARPAVRALLEAGARFELPPLAPIGVMMLFSPLMMEGLLALLAAVAARGVVLRVLGFEIVTADGQRARRWRILARTAIAWSPLFATVVAQEALGYRIRDVVTMFGAAVAALGAGALIAIAWPSRGLQDRLAGTWIVPR